MKLIFCLIFSAFALANTASNLAKSKAASAEISKKLEDLAADILNGEKSLKELDEQVTKVATRTKELEELVNAQNSELDVIILQNKDLIADKNALESKLVWLIAREFSYDLIAPKDVIESTSSILNSEVLNTLSSVLKGEFIRLGKNYELTINQINTKQQKIASINKNITDYKKRAAELKSLKDRQQKLLAKQKADSAEYKRRLEALSREQAQMQETLRKLKILEEQKQAAAAAKANSLPKKDATLNSNVKHASELGYSGAVIKYTGPKLLAPLEKYSLKQGFGYYTDPIYKLKIFNENVVLKSATPNANVRVVADGKVVYVGETAVLEKVVIIEHSGGLHSIYAHMDKFSRLAKVGTRLKAGNVVGKVRSELTFELTQKSAHVDPMTAIKR